MLKLSNKIGTLREALVDLVDLLLLSLSLFRQHLELRHVISGVVLRVVVAYFRWNKIKPRR